MSEKIEQFLQGQNVLITGGSGGIGAACAEEIARRGANVGINYHSSADEAEKTAQTCRDLGVKAKTYGANVANSNEVKAMFTEFCKDFGAIHGLLANAGIQKDDNFYDMTAEDWHMVLDINLTGQFYCAQEAARIFKKQGIQKGRKVAGCIVHMSSVHNKIPWAGHVNYATAKGGVDMLMKTASQGLASDGIRVNAIAPGAIKTEINEDVWSDPTEAKKLEKLIPAGWIGEPEEVAPAAAWLMSDHASYIHGTTIYIDGGMTLYPGFRDNG